MEIFQDKQEICDIYSIQHFVFCSTVEKIAEHLDISFSYVSRVERAAVKISLETLVKIAVFLETTPAFLIDGTIKISDIYLQGELAETIIGFDSDKMKLLLEVAQSINRFAPQHLR